jgi:lysophospholipase L1-like esterase
VLSVTLVILFCLVLLEIGLRVYCAITPNVDVEFYRYANLMKRSAPGSEVGFRHEPGSRLRLFGVDVEIDSRGFRDVEHARPRPPGTTRLLLLGDSITFGWGVPYGERFSEILEERWSAALGRPCEIVNTGHGNYNTAQESALLHELPADEPADGVLQVWYVNDAEPQPAHREAPWYARFRVAIFLWAKTDLLQRRVGARAGYADYYRGLYAPGAAGLADFSAALTRTGAWARERGVPWVFVVLPEFHDFAPGGPLDDVFARVRAEAAAAGAIVVDAIPAFRGHDPATIRVAVNDVHPNATGHAIIAAAILEAIDPAIFVGADETAASAAATNEGR